MPPIIGKIFGSLIGFSFGPIGLILGLLLGHLIDSIVSQEMGHTNFRRAAYTPDIEEEGLVYGLFQLFGAFVVAANGPNKKQLSYLQAVIDRFLTLSGYDIQVGIAAFQRALNERPRPKTIAHFLASNFIIDTLTLQWIWTVCKDLLRLGEATEEIWKELEEVAECFGFRVRRKSARSNFNEDFSSQYSFQHQKVDPYQIIGVERNATNDEIKAAFRRLARENHPDALSHLDPNHPERLQRQEKFIQIQNAYEEIRKERGF